MEKKAMSENRVVYKVNLEVSLTHELPIGCKPLHAAYQSGSICVWLLCDPLANKKPHSFMVIGTGWTMPEFASKDYIGSARNPNNSNIWHVFFLDRTEAINTKNPQYDNKVAYIEEHFPATTGEPDD
jgi:hypothetical protein